MAAIPSSVLRRLTVTATAASDGECLRRYLDGRDEAAFAELIRRNGPLVLRTCRAVLGDAAAADDAFQLTFLQLARNAARLTASPCLAGWLHTVAVRAAGSIRRADARRRRREQADRARPDSRPSDDVSWREVRERIDAELARLPEAYRLPVLLCYVQGLTYAEAADRIGCPLGALRGRLERGRQILRRRLERLGLPAALAAVVCATPPAVASGLRDATLTAVRSAPTAVGFTLLFGVARPKWVALAGCVAMVAGAGFLLAARSPADPPQPKPAPAAPAVAAARPDDARTTDAHGDPLPPGAVARLGSIRFSHGKRLDRVIVGDGKLVASYGEGYKLWDGETGRPVLLWDGLTKADPARTQFTLTPIDGKLAAVVSGGGQSRIVDPVTGKEIRTLPTPVPLPFAAVAPDGKTVASLMFNLKPGQRGFTLRVWTAESGRWTTLSESPVQGGMTPLHFSADGKTLAVRFSGGAVEVWDVPGAKLRLSTTGTGAQSLEGLALSPDGTLLAKEDAAAKKVRLWDVTTAKELPELPDQPDRLGQHLAFAPDGKTLAAVVMPNTIRLWDVPARKKLRDIRGHDYQMFGLAFTADGKRLYAADGSHVSVWDAATGIPLDDFGGHRYVVSAAAWSPDGKRVASGAAYTDNVGRVWDPATGRKVAELRGHRHGIEEIAYSPDGGAIATGNQDGTARLWDAATGKELHTFDAKDGMVYAMAFSPDGRFLLTGGRKAVHVWDVAARKEARSIPRAGGGGDLVLDLTVLPDGTRFLARDRSTGARVFDFATGREVIRVAAAALNAVAVSRDGESIATGHDDGSIRLWDTRTGRERQVLVGPAPEGPGDRRVMGLGFAPDGRTLGMAHGDGSVRVYETVTGSERFRFAGHTGCGLKVTFSPDGSRLCSGGTDRTLMVWDVTGDRLPSAPPPKDLDAAWADLASPDAARGFAAVRYLAADPVKAVPFVAARLKPVPAADPKVIADLIAKLGSPNFDVREGATTELTVLGEVAVNQLREAAGKATSPEVGRRLGEVLGAVGGSKRSGEQLRAGRAVEALERIGTADARKVLEALAGGAAGAGRTQDAEAALARLRSTLPR